jgi:hypothetical protein
MTGKRKNTSRGNGCMSNNAFNSWFMVALSFPLHEIVLRNYSNNNMGNQPFLGMPTTSKGFLITSPPPKKRPVSLHQIFKRIFIAQQWQRQ